MSLFEEKVSNDEYQRFKNKISEQLASLETELNTKTLHLEKAIELKASDSEKEAQEAAKNSIDIEKNIRGVESRVEEILTILEAFKDTVSEDTTEITKQRELLEKKSSESLSLIEDVNNSYKSFLEDKQKVDSAVLEIDSYISEIKKLLVISKALPSQIEEVSSLHEKAIEGSKNIAALLDGSIKRKNSIDDLHREILGYEIKGDDGTNQVVEGLKDELESAYNDLQNKYAEIDESIKSLISEIENRHHTTLEQQLNEFTDLVSNSKERVDAVDAELKALLPGSLAAGLSAAYEAKKDEEKKSQEQYNTQFGLAIIALVAISVVPFIIDAYLLIWKNKDIVDIIKDTPNLILSILPLYFPVLWYAFSSNKKLNLSKRLIEEYTHKSVLGRTFSGLSNQIINLPHENAVKEDLRTRLLFNLLQVSAENPGKLITDYNKSDHPFMEALENSAKLSAAVESLSKLPGFSAMAEKLSRKTKEFTEEQNQRVASGIATNEALETNEAEPIQSKKGPA